jgi:AbrB family looped-hinge helix DNA binding protein
MFRDRHIEGKAILPYLRAMSTLTITAKGQVTLRKDLLNHLGVQPGETVTVNKLPDGAIEVRPARQRGDISDVFGALKRKGGPRLSIKQMKKIAEEGWAGKR